MTKQHLGNLLYLSLFLLGLPLFADVTATVDNPAVYRGDPVTLTLSASGEEIRFPPLTEIAGFPIESRGTSRNLTMVNGKTSRSIEQRLVFTPTADVTIPALDITVDGTVEHTAPLSVKVLEPQAAPQGAPIRMEMHLSKTDVYVGEPVELDLVLKYKPGTQIDDIRISEPKFEHLWIKRINQQAERSADSEGYITQTYRYLLFAQQAGNLEIPAIFAQVGTRVTTQRRSMFSDPFFNDPFFGGARMQYRKVYSDPAALHAKALPEGLDVYGDFTMHSEVDKTAVDANKPVNLTIHIEGRGNVEDIKKFEPTIANGVVYANDPVVKSQIKDGEYYGTFDQTIAVIPGSDVTIAPQSFRFFDRRTHQVKTLRTQPYFIKVTGGTVPAAARVETAAPLKAAAADTAVPEPARTGTPTFEAITIFAAGFVIGAAFVGVLALRRKEGMPRSEKTVPMAKKIKAAKTERALFELLLSYKGEAPVIDDALDTLEANIYHDGKNRIDRQALADYFNGKSPETPELI